MAGIVFVEGNRADKAGLRVAPDITIEVRGDPVPYVSRGGLKLEWALERFGIDVEGKVAADIGASTGGFTDCLLQRGAAKVFAVDVGYGQLAWTLRQDPRVVVLERTNARYLTPEDLDEPVDLAVVDVSFISLGKIFPALVRLLLPQGTVVALIKPQFEAGPEQVGKRGVVRDAAVHRAVLQRVIQEAELSGLVVLDLTWSPVTGPEGNIEFFVHFSRQGPAMPDIEGRVAAVVKEGHQLRSQVSPR